MKRPRTPSHLALLAASSPLIVALFILIRNSTRIDYFDVDILWRPRTCIAAGGGQIVIVTGIVPRYGRPALFRIQHEAEPYLDSNALARKPLSVHGKSGWSFLVGQRWIPVALGQYDSSASFHVAWIGVSLGALFIITWITAERRLYRRRIQSLF